MSISAFHTRCIDPWLLRNRRRCPVCNQTVELSGPPSNEAMLAGHETVQPISFRSRLHRLRLIFASHIGVRRARTDWNSSAESSVASATGPGINDQDEERAPLLEQQQSPQESRYSTNPAYSEHMVTAGE